MLTFCRSLQRWLTLALLALMLAGCGAATANQGGQGDTSSTASPPSAPAAAQTRTIQHALGTIDVPANPQRVVVLDTGELDSALALGVTPVGAVEALPGQGFLRYLADRTGSIKSVGTIDQPNLETIAALKPDLILSNKQRHADIYPQLAAIAPTVFAERVGVVWKDNFRLVGAALGKAAEADQMMQAYDARIAALRDKLGPQGSQISVSIVRFLPDQIRLYQQGSFIGTILRDVGVQRPATQQLTDKTWIAASKERVADMDGDVLFVSSYGATDRTGLAAFKADPLWNQLQAVQQSRAYEVADDHWMLGIGIGAANRVLDDLEAHLTP